MPITSLAYPRGGNFQINDCILFVFNVEELSTDERKIIFKYQLMCAEDDKPAGKLKSYEPKQKGLLRIQGFRNEICRFLSTPLPEDLIDFKLPTDNGLKKSFYLKFYTEILDLADCDENGATSTIVNEGKTEVFTVQNSVFQTWKWQRVANEVPNTATGSTVMTGRPDCIHICRDGKDWIYVCPEEGNPITISQFAVKPNGDNFIVDRKTVIEPSIVCVGEATFGNIPASQVGEPLKGFFVRYTDADPANTSALRPDTYYHFKCCCADHMTIYFRESAGGFAGMFFCRKEGTTFGTTETRVCVYNEIIGNRKDIQKKRRRGAGNKISEKDGRERVTGTLNVPYTKGAKRWLQDFLVSEEYYYLDCDELGNEYLVKFLLEGNGAQTSQKDGCLQIVLSGTIEQPYFQNC